MHFFWTLLSALLLPFAAYAAPSVEEIMSAVAGPLDGSLGGGEFGGVMAFLASSAIPAVYIFATLFIVQAGFTLVTDQDDEQIARAKRIIISCISAIVLTNLASRIRDALMAIPGESGTVSIINAEVLGIISWIEEIIAVVAVTVIIVSGIRAIAQAGTEEGVTQLRKTIFAVITGIILIVFKFWICGSIVVTGNPLSGMCSGSVIASVIGGGGILGTILTIMNIVLGFIALVAVAVIVYAGFLMVANIANDDQYNRAKTLILRVAIGLMIIVASAAIVNLVLGISYEGGGVFFF